MLGKLKDETKWENPKIYNHRKPLPPTGLKDNRRGAVQDVIQRAVGLRPPDANQNHRSKGAPAGDQSQLLGM